MSGIPRVRRPLGVYINWSSYDELSDNVPLDEALALRQFDELLRLRALGVQLDVYIMDAFWFARDSGYRAWRTPHWPDGPDRWLALCAEHGVTPGLWFGANNPAWGEVIPEWQDSFDPETGCLCCFYGGFLGHYVETLEHWYARGVRVFKIDFADFRAAPPGVKTALLPSEIREANVVAYRGALKAFRARHADVVFLAYNGFEERSIQGATDEPRAKVLDARWLEAFDAVYCGDARPSDVPAMNFWRSKDVYSDHMVRRYVENDVPVSRIDNVGFMIGTTGTCYWRGVAAWRGMLVLSLARGGWVNTYYGNLELLGTDDARWFAAVQGVFFGLQRFADLELIGGEPGSAQVYGYHWRSDTGALVVAVNPAQGTRSLALPAGDWRVVFADAGSPPALTGDGLRLGAEGMAVLGRGDLADLNWGEEPDVHVPADLEPLEGTLSDADGLSLVRAYCLAQPGRVRLVLRLRDAAGRTQRLIGGDGRSLGALIRLEVTQHGRALEVMRHDDKVVWSGLSWGVGEVDISDAGAAFTVRCQAEGVRAEHLELQALRVVAAGSAQLEVS
jgi:hypothetical protein